ncbi:nucleoside-diphosphate sugar epimerase [Mucilaginibacter hurinus]|uniref:Nucleoside-diphosphate sugar epimerase n=1 Tax=Mucilaginibacter hurinus TaxID=2201324 RepID=A0A367GQR4_9SPHI|nr:NAD(P)H-binding protein [Mucilaginibacter hurinus]RCH55053.1 nucleoside-diphosphate sugar epimerase [Mucilaginibacter hurinus]
MAYKAIIAGASGLIGSKLVQLLLNNQEYNEVVILVRNLLPITHPKLLQVVTRFEELDNYANIIEGHALFCCLGTTKAKTPDKNIYRMIDHDYPVKLAQLAAQNGVNQYHLVSAIGANAGSSQFYLRTKGETELDVIKSGMRRIDIYQPSFLTGRENETRLGEIIAGPVFSVLDPLLLGGLKKYRSIPAFTVAKAMVNQSLKLHEGVFTYPSDKIKLLA